jgi:hypothetical protein
VRLSLVGTLGLVNKVQRIMSDYVGMSGDAARMIKINSANHASLVWCVIAMNSCKYLGETPVPTCLKPTSTYQSFMQLSSRLYLMTHRAPSPPAHAVKDDVRRPSTTHRWRQIMQTADIRENVPSPNGWHGCFVKYH